MSILALGALAWTIAGILLLFGSLVVLTFSLGLARQSKALAARVSTAKERLQEEMADVAKEAREAQERIEGIGRRRRK